MLVSGLLHHLRLVWCNIYRLHGHVCRYIYWLFGLKTALWQRQGHIVQKDHSRTLPPYRSTHAGKRCKMGNVMTESKGHPQGVELVRVGAHQFIKTHLWDIEGKQMRGIQNCALHKVGSSTGLQRGVWGWVSGKSIAIQSIQEINWHFKELMKTGFSVNFRKWNGPKSWLR